MEYLYIHDINITISHNKNLQIVISKMFLKHFLGKDLTIKNINL